MMSFAEMLETKAYSFPPVGKMLDIYNSIRNRKLLKYEERRFERLMEILLDETDLLAKLEGEPFEADRFVHVSNLGAGASGEVALVNDKKGIKTHVALKKIDIKSHLRSHLQTFQYNNIGHRLRTTSPNERLFKAAFKPPSCNRAFDYPPKESPRELLASLISTELSETRKEIEVLRQLKSCRYIVDFYGAFVDMANNNIYISTEHCDLPLSYFICRNMIFSFVELQAVVSPILLGLREMHKQGYAHMDLKPENILVKRNGCIRLCDFGSTAIIGLTPQQVTLTYRYVSPELFYVHHRAIFGSASYYGITTPSTFYEDSNLVKCDVWSVGIVLVTLSVGMTAVDKFFGREWNPRAKDEFHVKDMVMQTCDGGNSRVKTTFDSLLQLLEANQERKKYGFLLECLQKLFEEAPIGAHFCTLLESLLKFDWRTRATIEEVCTCEFLVGNDEIGLSSLELKRKTTRVVKSLIESTDHARSNDMLK